MKKDQNLHRCFWCVHKIVKKNYWNLYHGFWWAHNIVKKDRNLHHCFWWVHNIAKETLKICIKVFDMFTTFWKKKPKFASPVLIYSRHCEKRETCVTVFDVFAVKKDRKFYDGFWYVENIVKKRLNLASRFLMCFHNFKKRSKLTSQFFDLLTTLWKRDLN